MPFGAEQHAVHLGRVCCFTGISSIESNAAYDLIKHSILAVLAKVNGKRKENEEDGTKLVIEVCKKDSNGKFGDRKVVTVSTSYKMSEDERERTISKLVGYSLYEDQE